MRTARADISEMARIACYGLDCLAAFHLADVTHGIDAVIDKAGADCGCVQPVDGIAIAGHNLTNGFAVFEFQQTLFDCF